MIKRYGRKPKIQRAMAVAVARDHVGSLGLRAQDEAAHQSDGLLQFMVQFQGSINSGIKCTTLA